jgi:hypothetical protein
LSVNIGPRGPTSSNEKKAAEYIEQVLRSTGAEVNSEKFLSTSSFYWMVSVYLLSFVLTVFLFPISSIVVFILDLIIVLVFLQEMQLRRVLFRIMPKGESANIIGKMKAKVYPKKRVIITGHYDSAKSLPFFHPRIVKYFDFLVLFAGASMIIVTFLFGFGAFSNYLQFLKGFSSFFWFASFPFILYLGFIGIFLVYGELFAKTTDGANDNASGIAVALGVADILSKNPLENTEVWFVATGCEEAGTVGMSNFLEKHADELKNSYILNIDCVGTGDLKYVIKEGLLKTISVPEELVRIVSEVAAKEPTLKASPLVLRYKASDSFPALSVGLKAICIISVDERNLPLNWHWKTDVFNKINGQSLENAQELLLGALKNIDTVSSLS